MTRKEFVLLTAGAACALPLAGCDTVDDLLGDAEMKLCAQSELVDGGIVKGKFNGRGIQMMQVDGQWVVFSLRCRHKRCTVKWKEEERIFACPCHEGVYDARGNVQDGPPKDPLFRLKWEARNGEIWVLNEKLNA